VTKEQRDRLSPGDIIALMKNGNERFRLGQESPHDYLAQKKASAKGQYPAAELLSCIDPRAPAETNMASSGMLRVMNELVWPESTTYTGIARTPESGPNPPRVHRPRRRA